MKIRHIICKDSTFLSFLLWPTEGERYRQTDRQTKRKKKQREGEEFVNIYCTF